jgi:hypothetical protein
MKATAWQPHNGARLLQSGDPPEAGARPAVRKGRRRSRLLADAEQQLSSRNLSGRAEQVTSGSFVEFASTDYSVSAGVLEETKRNLTARD